VLSIDAGKTERWSWILYIDAYVEARLDGFNKHGSAGDRDSVKADIERNWKLWLDAAELTERKGKKKVNP
jgi:hypothetical protein